METKSTIENLEGEIWKTIVGYEGLYEVSNKGRVKSLARLVECRNGSPKKLGVKVVVKEKVLKGLPRNGYYHVELHKNYEVKQYKIHRLVAMAFIPNPNNYPIINHKDENPKNNCVENLEWCDYKYNANYGNCRKKMSESDTKKRGVKVIQKDKNGNVLAIYNSITEASHATGIPKTNIHRVVRGTYVKGWNDKYYIRTTAGGFLWELS